MAERPAPLAAGDRVSGWPGAAGTELQRGWNEREARPGARRERLSQLLTWALLQDGGQAEACTGVCAETEPGVSQATAR